MRLSSIFTHRVRGFRLIEMVALGLLAALVLGVYCAKTMAGGERAQIASIESQIAAERARVRLLDAEVAHLERPRRVAHLAEAYLSLKPLAADRETTADDLAAVAAKPPAKSAAKAPAT